MPSFTRLGKYEIRRELGKGSMGVVYEAYDPVIGRRVAIKVIRRDGHGADEEEALIVRLRREAQAAGRLNHPRVVSIYDFGEDDTLGGGRVAYIAMELIEGQELKQLIDSGRRFSPSEAARVVDAVLAALQHAHERGVTHRDIKPANVILLADGDVKVADFGVARIDSSDLTQAGTMIGTPQSMSPEQLLGLPVDGRSDLFACGVMLYELLTGEKPFSGSVTTVIQKVLNHEPPPPSRVNPGLGTDWDAVVARALAKQPEQRYASAGEMREALQAAAHAHAADATVLAAAVASAGAPSDAAAAGSRPGATTPGAVGTPVPGSGPSPGVGPGVRRGRAAVVAATLVGSAAVAGMLYVGWLRPGPAPDARVASAGAEPARPASATPTPPPVTAPVPAPAASDPPAAPASAAATSPAPSAPVAVASTAPPATAATPSTASPGSAARRPAASAAPPSAADWSRRIARLQAAKPPLTLVSAFSTLLEPLSTFERDTLERFESTLARRPGKVGMAIGAKEGRYTFWTSARADTQTAIDASLQDCRRNHGVECRTLLADGELRREALVAATRELGAAPVDEVRVGLLRSMAVVTQRMQAETARATPASAPPAAASAAVADWAQRVARVQSAKGTLTLGAALGLLLGPLSDADRRTIAEFEAIQRKRPPKVAISMGVRNGYFAYWTWYDADLPTAQNRSRQECERNHKVACDPVYVDGDLRRSAFVDVARTLGTRPVEQVRESLLRAFADSVRRYPP